ncbi:ribonuclease inhibitor [Amia ocellicauda]|uniref:ribonuclease inhibitor n=1 Tax=Amia ocellicauda TaxID=2972642 RepID=UPI003464B8A0
MILVNSSITELNLTNNYVGDLGVKHLTALLSRATCNISKLGLANNSLSAACCTDLATLVSSSQALKELSLSKNDFAASGFTIQFSELSQPTCQLEELELFCCGITAQCCEDLAANLHSNHVLKKLVLRNNKLEDRGVEQLCSAFQQPISALRTLQLEGCMLTSKCCAALATVLEKSRSLQHLGLDWNDIGDEGVRQLCQGLQTPGCVLQTLEMESCELTAGCCGELAQTLSSSHSLTCLVLSDNELGDQGVKLLSAGLKHPNCVLQTLVLQENNLTAACCKDLEQALDSSSHLTTLDLSRNLLTDKSVSYLQGLAQSCVSLCTVELRLNKLSRHGKSKLNYPQSWKVSFNI